METWIAGGFLLKLAIVVFSPARPYGALETHHRDLRWKALGVPV